jgi:REP element-mobilizing transposase RayT
MATEPPHSSDLRKGRSSAIGQYYFLTAVVADRRPIFLHQDRANIVIDAIRWLSSAKRFVVDAAVVMPDHLHMAGQLADRSLASVMHTLKGYTAIKLLREGVRAPVWQPGFHDHALRDDEDYRLRIRYLLDNPRRAGLVARAEDYAFTILPKWWK